MAETEVTQILLSDFVEKTSADLESIFPPLDIQILLTKTKEILKKVNKLKLKWEQMNESAFQENPVFVQRKGEESPHASRTATAYKVLWDKNHNHNNQYQEIMAVIIEAELFIDKVREFFTGRKITYSVGVRYESQLYEYNLTLADVLSNAIIGIDAKNQGLKLRIAQSKSKLIQAYGTLNAAGKDSEVTIQEEKMQTNTNEELYNKMYDYWLAGGKTINGVKLNEGQLYETYRYIVAEGKYKNIDITLEKDIAYLTNAATRTIKNTTSGRQGGDVLDAQVKFFNASFASLNEIWRTLIELFKVLHKFIRTKHKKEFKQGMKKLFTKNKKDIENIELGLQKDVKQHVDNVIKSISGITFT